MKSCTCSYWNSNTVATIVDNGKRLCDNLCLNGCISSDLPKVVDVCGAEVGIGRIACKYKPAIPLHKYIDSSEFRTTSNAKHLARLQYSTSQYNYFLGTRSKAFSLIIVRIKVNFPYGNLYKSYVA